jgi:hypothetical protein
MEDAMCRWDILWPWTHIIRPCNDLPGAQLRPISKEALESTIEWDKIRESMIWSAVGVWILIWNCIDYLDEICAITSDHLWTSIFTTDSANSKVSSDKWIDPQFVKAMDDWPANLVKVVNNLSIKTQWIDHSSFAPISPPSLKRAKIRQEILNRMNIKAQIWCFSSPSEWMVSQSNWPKVL